MIVVVASMCSFFFFNDTATTEIYTLSLHDALPISGSRLKELRRGMQMIFQDPYSSLNPRKTVGSIIADPFLIHGLHKDARERKRAVQDLMDLVDRKSVV